MLQCLTANAHPIAKFSKQLLTLFGPILQYQNYAHLKSQEDFAMQWMEINEWQKSSF